MLTIQSALDNDFNVIWPIFHPVVGQADTYPHPPDTNRVTSVGFNIVGTLPCAFKQPDHGL